MTIHAELGYSIQEILFKLFPMNGSISDVSFDIIMYNQTVKVAIIDCHRDYHCRS
jgi:hypothetical protein